MKIPLHSYLLALAGLATGLLVSRSGDDLSSSVESPSSSAKAPLLRSAGRPDPGGALEYDPEHTLAGLLSLNYTRLYSQGTGRKIQSADSEDLKELLAGLPGGQRLTSGNLRRAIVREVYRRDGAGVLDWAAGLENPLILGDFITCLAHDDARSAVKWYGTYKEKVRNYYEAMRASGLDAAEAANFTPWHANLAVLGVGSSFAGSAMLQGLDVALEVKEAMSGTDYDWLSVHYLPDDFDYERYLDALEPREVGLATDQLFSSWAVHDPGAALAYALKRQRSAPAPPNLLFPAVMNGVSRMHGEAAAATWLVETLSRYQESDRTTILTNLSARFRPSPTLCREVMAALPEEDKIAYAVSGIGHVKSETQRYLEALPSQAARVAAIEAAARKRSRDPVEFTRQTAMRRKFFESLMDTHNVPEDVRVRVRAMW